MGQGGDADKVLEANRDFYQAFESLDAARMAEVWAHDGVVKCVHPGWPLLQGWEAVKESWERIFDNASAMQFTIANADATVHGDVAWVTCTEHLISVVDGRVAEGKVQATNVFRREQDGWRLVHHHGSPVA